MKEEIKTLAESFNIRHKLYFAGLQKDVMPYLSIMDIGVNCSEKEGLSNAIMEYMAAGVPCVVSNAGGNTDLITHNVNGYTFELDDYKTLAALTLKLLDDQKTRRNVVKHAREKVEREMTVDAMLFNYDNLYQRLAEKS